MTMPVFFAVIVTAAGDAGQVVRDDYGRDQAQLEQVYAECTHRYMPPRYSVSMYRCTLARPRLLKSTTPLT